MTYIKWTKDYSVGIQEIDSQHKHFIDLLNSLYKRLEAKDVTKLPIIIDDLLTYAAFHFKEEAGYFKKFNYVDADEHNAMHDDLMKKAKSFLDKKGDPIDIGFELLYFLERWLLIHFKGADQKYSKVFSEHGLLQ